MCNNSWSLNRERNGIECDIPQNLFIELTNISNAYSEETQIPTIIRLANDPNKIDIQYLGVLDHHPYHQVLDTDTFELQQLYDELVALTNGLPIELVTPAPMDIDQ
jgi:hypothetical protein